MTYEPEPPLTQDEREALESVKRRESRARARKELAQHKPTPGAVLVIHRATGEHELRTWGDLAGAGD